LYTVCVVVVVVVVVVWRGRRVPMDLADAASVRYVLYAVYHMLYI
jgi:hypothetical protein